MQSPRSKLFQRRGKKVWSSRGWVLFCIWLVEMWVFETDHRAKRRKAKVIPVTFDTRFELLTTNRYSKSVKRVKTWITKTRLLLVLHLIFWEAGAIFLQNQSNPGLVSTLNNKTAFWYCTSLRNTAPFVTPTEFLGLMFTSLERNGVFIAPSKRGLDTSIDNCGNGFTMTASPFQRTNVVIPFHIWKLYGWYLIIVMILLYDGYHRHYYFSYTLLYQYPFKRYEQLRWII